MEELRLKKITILIIQTLLLQGNTTISEGFAYMFNEFIYTCFKENNELLSAIYDTELLKEFIDNNYEVLSFEQMATLIKKYQGLDGYVKLLDEIDLETLEILNELSQQFIEYQEEMLTLYYADPTEYFPKGYSKILQ